VKEKVSEIQINYDGCESISDVFRIGIGWMKGCDGMTV
jgi:hypothetical protein